VEVGFIGLGDQGAPMARAIAHAGHRLHLWARRPEVLTPFADVGAILHPTPAALAGAVEHLGLCVLDEGAVMQLLVEHHIDQALRPGSVVAIHTTMTAAGCRDRARQLAVRGVELLDAPISGGREAAEARALLILVGGDTGTLERARPVFSSYADRIVYAGGIGAGQTFKILNNLLLNANLAAAQDVLRFGTAIGLDRAALRKALLEGTGASVALDWLDRTILPGHSATLGRKDVSLAVALAHDHSSKGAAIETLAAAALRGRELLAEAPDRSKD
jgi:3-hydroxyisobutyrate dehydrogenase-like beta-hydroxyacid dehydrogenase